ncbi:hypothetical protein AYO44_00600 [Planctomycetaceae bacterium SCGC AG-212-F19]|nr:hypothetical protein AYO44_00600 [Planctomycetaceae bacterium SCGC AG-212-F19]
MFLLEPPPTPLDLKWQMFGIPVRVHPLFWLVTAFLGLGALRQGFAYLLLWVVCVFVSILIHELGHVIVGKMFGSHGHILLYSFGGLAIGSGKLAERWQRIAVCLAGPGSQFLLLILVAFPYAAYSVATQGEGSVFLSEFFFFLFIINGFWAVLNLMPIWPLDGGQVSREIFEALNPATGQRTSLMVSLVCAVVLAVAGLFLSFYTALLFGSLAFCSWQLLYPPGAQPTLDQKP